MPNILIADDNEQIVSILSEYAKKEFNSDFIFITHYPVEKRPMYTYEDESDKGYTKSFDLLFITFVILF